MLAVTTVVWTAVLLVAPMVAERVAHSELPKAESWVALWVATMEFQSAEKTAGRMAARKVAQSVATMAVQRAAKLGPNWADLMVAMMAAMTVHHSAD